CRNHRPFSTVTCPDTPNQGVSVVIGHSDIGNDDVGTRPVIGTERLLNRRRCRDDRSLGFKQDLYQFAGVVVVFHNENADVLEPVVHSPYLHSTLLGVVCEQAILSVRPEARSEHAISTAVLIASSWLVPAAGLHDVLPWNSTHTSQLTRPNPVAEYMMKPMSTANPTPTKIFHV